MESTNFCQNQVAGALQPDCTVSFMNLCEELARFAAQHDIFLIPHNEKGLLNFKSLDFEKQTFITAHLTAYLQQIYQAAFEKITLRGDNRQHVWWSLKNLRLVPPSDLLDKISSDDIIEIYNNEGIQVFRSFELFQHISYSLSEIFTFTWMELFERDEFVFKRVFDAVDKVLAGEVTGVVKQQLPPHVLKEKFSNEKKWIEIQQGVLCPLQSVNGSLGGYLYSFKILNYGSDAIINPFISTRASQDLEI